MPHREESAPTVQPTVASAAAQEQPANAPQQEAASSTVWMLVHVHDEVGAPITNARVELEPNRHERAAESAATASTRLPIALTDELGNSRLPCGKNDQVSEARRVVDLAVTHSDYLPVKLHEVTLGPSRLEVTMEPARRVIVTAVAPDGRMLTDFVVHADREDRTTITWVARPDGRQETTRLSAGIHTIWVECEPAESVHLSSSAVSIEVTDTGSQEVIVQLLPSSNVRGKLADVVPRPVRNGQVRLIAHVGRKMDYGFVKTLDAPILEDGTFEVQGVPPGFCEVFALCSEWVTTTNSVAERTELRRASSASDPSHWDAGPDYFTLRHIDVPAASRVVLPMERTGVVRFQVRDKNGHGIGDASVGLSVSFRTLPGYGSSAPWRKWSAVTDSEGVAIIEDVPAAERMSADARMMFVYEDQDDESERTVITVKSGVTTDVTLVLGPK
ncbi:MAG: hypothetical protein JNL28_01220 [Planctomycetes bacterium]|nr:hypothetical protein [Planctomycetota bacterium]